MLPRKPNKKEVEFYKECLFDDYIGSELKFWEIHQRLIDRGELEKVLEDDYCMKKFEVEIHWDPSTIVVVEAETREQAEEIAVSENGADVDHCVVTELEDEEEE